VCIREGAHAARSQMRHGHRREFAPPELPAAAGSVRQTLCLRYPRPIHRVLHPKSRTDTRPCRPHAARDARLGHVEGRRDPADRRNHARRQAPGRDCVAAPSPPFSNASPCQHSDAAYSAQQAETQLSSATPRPRQLAQRSAAACGVEGRSLQALTAVRAQALRSYAHARLAMSDPCALRIQHAATWPAFCAQLERDGCRCIVSVQRGRSGAAALRSNQGQQERARGPAAPRHMARSINAQRCRGPSSHAVHASI
jgi:hypothetical protein